MGNLLHQIYVMPLSKLRFLIYFLIIIWSCIDYLVKKDRIKAATWKFINRLGFFCIFFAILAATIISRENTTEVILTPFHFIEEAKQQPEIYRSMLMNVFLFFPLGLTLPFALPERWKGKVLLAVGFAFLLSAGIEFAQYYFHLGRAEVDDIICNTFGAFLGTLALLISRFRYKRMEQKEHLKSSEQ